MSEDGVLSFTKPPKSLYFYYPPNLLFLQSVFKQVIMPCSSKRYIYLFDESINNTGFKETLNIYAKEVQE